MKKFDAPKFQIGSVVDISYKFGGLPNRVLICGIHAKEFHNEWQYDVLLENIGEHTNMSETFIKDRMVTRKQPVYNNTSIIKRYADGFRFCGNYPHFTARAEGEKLKDKLGISSIILCTALDYNGCIIKDKLGLWIRYSNVIMNDGFVKSKDGDGITVIK